MSIGGRICPHCRKYTTKADARCIHCDKYIGPVWLSGLMRTFNAAEAWGTSTIVGLNVLVFVAQVVVQTATDEQHRSPLSILWSGMTSEALFRFGAVPLGNLAFIEPWRLLTACVLHMNLLHIVFNMIALGDYGRMVEPDIKGARLIAGFFVTGVIGFVASGLWYDAGGVTAGASGAVFGVQGLTLGQMRAKGDPRFREMVIRTVGYAVIFAFAIRSLVLVNNAAHLGGLAAGIVLGYAFAKESRPWQRSALFGVLAVVCLLATLAALAYAQWSYLHISLDQ